MKPYPDHPKAKYFVNIGLFDDLESFEQLNQRIFDLGLEMNQNDRNGYRGAAFEVFVEALLTVIHPNRFTDVLPKKRWSIDLRNELSIPRTDKGIDFICDRPRDGQELYSTVQAKWRQDPNHTLTYGKDDTSRFYGQGDLAKLHEKLIVTNCPRVTPDLRLQPKATFMLRHELDRLKPADFRQIETWLKGRKLEREKAKPRPYQIAAVNRLAEEFEERERVSCIMFCGTGKTLVALWLLEAMDSKLTLVLVPTLALLDQFQNDWRNELEFDSIFVCSDETVGQDGDFKFDDLPFKVTSDIQRIRRFMDSSGRRKIVFSTYQSSQKIQMALENTHHRFELGIFDEAHKTTGRAKPERNYSIALKDERIPIIKRAFFTATPRRYKVRKGEVTDEEFFSMDKVDDYGHPVVPYNYKQARDDKWVTPFEIYVSVISEADIDQELADRPALHAELIKQGVTNIHGDEIRSAQVADQITARLMIKSLGCKKLFVYNHSVAAAESFVKNGPEGFSAHYPGFWCKHIHGLMDVEERRKYLNELKRRKEGLIANVNCLTEGINAPSVDGILICVAKQSPNDIIQMIGRGVRTSEETGKTCCRVGLTILKEPDETIEEAAARSRFDTLLTVLESLQTQGFTPEEIRELMIVKRVKGFTSRPERKELERPLVELDELEQIKLYAFEALRRDSDGRWNTQFAKAEEYFKEFGHCNISREEEQQNYDWQVVQRGLAKKGGLRPDREARLKSINFCFDTDKAVYLGHAQALLDWYERTGTWVIPQKTEKALTAFAVRVRQAKREDRLPREVIEPLEAKKFPWDPNEERKKQHLWIVQQIGKVFQKNGNRRVPAEYRHYVMHWRKAEKEQKLDPEIKAALIAIDCPFDPHEEVWDEMFARFLELQRTGVEPTNRDKSWINNQRMDFKAGRMLPERAERFRKVGYDFNSDQRDEAWQKRYKEYCQYVRKTGDRYGHKAPKPLRSWMSIQRREYRAKKLSEERIKLLEAAGFLWEHPTTSYPHTHCSRGHEFTEENTGWDKRGTRRCLKCDALRARLKRAKGKREVDNEKSA